MYQIIFKNLEKRKLIFIFIFVLLSLLIFAVLNKNTSSIKNLGNNKTSFLREEELNIIRDFLFKQIKSPFKNIKHEIKKGDSIGKILRNYNVENSQIQEVIEQYKVYGKANQLLVGNVIDLTIEKNITSERNSIIKFFIPVTKSTSIEIKNNEFGKLQSEKIITKLYKKTVVAENIIKNSLYSSAINSKVNPDTIIEFARIFGFEIDFQRDIRKNDYFKIVYDKYFDENNEMVKTGSILFAHMSVNGREITLYKFGSDKSYGYFDINGKSVEKALMKTPINGARLSSSYGMRKHPILGFNKMHMGTDFAAPMGTPIMASGSGTITRAKWCGGG